MNLPNQLTVLRLFLTALFAAVMSAPVPGAGTIGLLLFLVACLTDYVDGYLARRWNLITDFGKLIDSLADKVLVASAFVCLVELRLFPAWGAVVIIAREFLITGLRLLAASKGTVLSAEKIGKHKTFWQMTTILILLMVHASKDWVGWLGEERMESMQQLSAAAAPGLVGVTVFFTIFSGLTYLYRHCDLIADR